MAVAVHKGSSTVRLQTGRSLTSTFRLANRNHGGVSSSIACHRARRCPSRPLFALLRCAACLCCVLHVACLLLVAQFGFLLQGMQSTA